MVLAPELAWGVTEPGAVTVPHCPQNFAWSGSGCPHCTQVRVGVFISSEGLHHNPLQPPSPFLLPIAPLQSYSCYLAFGFKRRD